MKKLIMVSLVLVMSFSVSAQETWRGLVVEKENRCSPYNKKTQYPYPQSVEDTIVDLMDGRVYGPYTGSYFKSDYETDIEHIVAASEGHDSGLCRASKQTRKNFATDQLNLTLASPEVNRCGAGGKCGFDAADWMPKQNKCWFANRIVLIKTKYSLSVDEREARALENVLSRCDNFDMNYSKETGGYTYDTPIGAVENDGDAVEIDPTDALAMYDDNGNGRITCSEARAHGITPVMNGDIAYEFMRDADGDGVVCR